MIDERLYSEYPYYGALTADDLKYDPDKPRFKDIFWKHYDWLKEIDAAGARPCILDNVQRMLLCNTVYLGYDYFECPQCGNFYIENHKCHSRLCTKCGMKTQKLLAARAESMCVNADHRRIVFTIPEEYRNFFRIDRKFLIFCSLRLVTLCVRCLTKTSSEKRKGNRRKQVKSGMIKITDICIGIFPIRKYLA
jgi:hypothetical protein